MSLLSKQLKQIADEAPHLKSHPTLVMTYSQARDTDRHAIFAIGENGLQELVLLDHSFESFENDLFSDKIIEGDILLASPEEKQILDKRIKEFLVKLSPFFLHHAAFKALEWLLRRFRIHEYNVDDVIECILPFHETPQFIHVVRTLIFTEKCRYGFVQACKKSKVPLERSTIVQRCLKDVSCLRLFCSLFNQTIENGLFNKYVNSFFLCTITEYLTLKKKPEQDALVVIYSSLSKASLNQGMPLDFVVTSLVLFGQLAHLIVFTDQVFLQIQQAFDRLLSQDCLSMVILSLMQIYQAQPQLSKVAMDSTLVDSLLQFKEFEDKLLVLSRKYNASALISGLVLCLAKSNELNFVEFLNGIVVNGLLDNELTSQVFDLILETGNANSARVLKSIVERNSELIAPTIQKHLNTPTSFEMLSDLFKGSVHEPINNELTLFTALKHPQPEIRCIGIQNLFKSLAESSQPELVQLAIQCFDDPELMVIEKLLNQDLKFIDQNELAQLLLKIDHPLVANQISKCCQNCNSENSKRIHIFVLEMFSNESEIANLIKSVSLTLFKSALKNSKPDLESVLNAFSGSKFSEYYIELLQSEKSKTRMFAMKLVIKAKPNALLVDKVLDVLTMATGPCLDEFNTAAECLNHLFDATLDESTYLNHFKRVASICQNAPATCEMQATIFKILQKSPLPILELITPLLVDQSCSEFALGILNEYIPTHPQDYSMLIPILTSCLCMESRKKAVACLVSIENLNKPVLLQSLLKEITSRSLEFEADATRIKYLLVDVLDQNSLKAFLSLIQKSELSIQIALLEVIELVDHQSKLVKLMDLFDNCDFKLGSRLVKCITSKSVSKMSDSKKLVSLYKKLLATPLADALIKQSCGLIMDFESEKRIRQVFNMMVDAALTSTQVSNSVKECSKSLSDSVLVSVISEAKESLKKLEFVLECASCYSRPSSNLILAHCDLVKDVYLKNQVAINTSVPELEFIIQQVMSNLIDLLAMPVKLATVPIDQIVQAVRTSQNTQSRNLMLQCLAEFSKVCPDLVLINILPIFTFMGATVLRQDDAFSFHVIQQTMQTIIPNLVSNNHSTVVQVVKMFTDAVSHVPKHRRLKLFTLLTSTLGESVYLGLMIRYLIAKSVQILELNQSFDQGFILFIKSVCEHFSAETRLSAVFECLEFIEKMPETCKKLQESKIEIDFIVSDKQISSFKTEIAGFCTELLNSVGSSDSSIVLNITECTLRMMQKSTVDRKDLQLLLDAATRLMPVKEFVKLVLTLIVKGDSLVRHSSLELLHEKISELDQEKSTVEVFDTVLECLKAFLENCESVACRDLTCLILSEMTLKFGAAQQEKYAQLMNIAELPVTTSTLALASSLLTSLGPRCLPMLPKIIPKITEKANGILENNNLNSNLLQFTGIIGFFAVLLETLPNFTSPYLQSIISIMINPLLLQNKVNNSGLDSRLVDLTNAMTGIKIRILFPRICESFKKAEPISIVELFELLLKAFTSLSKTELAEQYKQMNSFFVGVFDWPIVYSDHKVSRAVIAAHVQMCLKFNESMFKPCFIKVIDWLKVAQASNNEEKIIFFYELANAFLLKLKTIFAPFSVYFFDDLVSLLESKNCNEQLKQNALMVVQKMFLYDQDGVLKSKAAKLVNGLVAQIEMDKPDYLQAMEEYVIPAISQVAVNVRDEALWKQMNHEICQLTRSADPEKRFVSLRLINEFFNRIGEEFLVLLPETIPFIAELLEDQDEMVEKLCHQTCRDIELILGEDIQQYFE